MFKPAPIEGVEQRTADTNGIRWSYLRAGSGPPLLLVHGLMAYSFSWRLTIRGLAQHFSVYAVDLPGCGASERSSALPGTLASDAQHLLSFADHMGLEQFDVLGTSRGGGATIAMTGLAAQLGQLSRIRKLVLSAPINPWSRIGGLRIRLLRRPSGRYFLVHLSPRMPFILKYFHRRIFFDPAAIPPDSFEGYRDGLSPDGSLLHLWNITRSWTDDLQLVGSVLPSIETVPALLLWGEHDSAVAPASAEELHRRWKNSVVVMMKGQSHMPYEEAPEEFDRIVLDFLLRDAPATPLRNMSQAQVLDVAAEPTIP